MLATVRSAETTDVHFLTYPGSRSPKTKVLILGVGSLRPPSLAPDGCLLFVIVLLCGHRSHWIAQSILELYCIAQVDLKLMVVFLPLAF